MGGSKTTSSNQKFEVFISPHLLQNPSNFYEY
ncbi:hypothetical protein Ccrd_001432 [Cynara cardunculus var. scolymus]|uniref:Uncharacterized protein n=1 Tax=Cynara cardunculus var. scolymus TaxID=59895 RepID=A0A103XTB8_CYNCS|nr:hypothetical protein Ccrd_001432 [Cynara cardunculus var. scolymus]